MLDKAINFQYCFIGIYFLFLSISSCSAQVDTKIVIGEVKIESEPLAADSIVKILCKLASNRDKLKLNQFKIEKQIKFIESKNEEKDKNKLNNLRKNLSTIPAKIQLIEKKQAFYKEKLFQAYKSLNAGYTFEFKKVKYQIYILNDSNSILSIHHKDGNGHKLKTFSNVKRLIDSIGSTTLMITNAGMYTPEFDPEGLLIENNKQAFPLNTRDSEIFLNFYMHPNGVFYQHAKGSFHVCTTDSFNTMSQDSTFMPILATQSGPMLKIDGEIHPKFNWNAKSRKIRSGVGIYNGLCIFAITRDNSNFYDFASFYTEIFDCKNAIYLDGAISKMYEPELSPKDVGGNFGPIISISKK